MQAASRAGAELVVLLGEDELARGDLLVKEMATGVQRRVVVGPANGPSVVQGVELALVRGGFL